MASVGIASVAPAQEEARLSVSMTASQELVIAVQPGFHARYGCAYPLTFQMNIPSTSAALLSQRKYSSGESYVALTEKKAGDLFNAVEAVRFDYGRNRAYVSAALEASSDSLFIRIIDSTGNPVPFKYLGISRYYDDRRAALTVTADDWADWTQGWYPSLLSIFRRYGIYVTAGVISGIGNTSRSTWAGMQKELDLGYVEIAAHSRTHPYTPYADPQGEVIGCYEDIITRLVLPPLFKADTAQYVYVWLAPYGDYDATTDSLLGVAHYLVPRLYSYVQTPMSNWDDHVQHFAPINPTLEIGAPSWGGGDTDITSLNGTFDTIAAQGGVYHFMWHPQVVITDTASPYFINHLEHVSRRSDIWYVNLGHLYLYHMIQEMNSTGLTSVAAAMDLPAAVRLDQNYPNPFNPSTTIRYSLPQATYVHLTVFNTLGRRVAVLVNEKQERGTHEVRFDGSNLASGVYFYRLNAGNYAGTKKLLLLK